MNIMCQIWYDYVKGQKNVVRTQSHVKNPINLTLGSKVDVVLGLWMYATYPLMVIDPCSKHGKQMSKQTEVTGRTWRHVKNLIYLTLRSKVKVVSGSWMYITHPLIVINKCATYLPPTANLNPKKPIENTMLKVLC